MKLFRIFLMSASLLWTFPKCLSAQSFDSLESPTLLGVWEMDVSVQMQKNISFQRKGQKPLQDQHFERQFEIMRSRTYVFEEGGRFESSWVSDGNLYSNMGQWELIEKGIVLIKIQDEGSFQYVATIDRNRLVLGQLGVDKTVLREIYLKRLEP